MTIETNKIYCGDNLELLRNKQLFPDNSVDLIYLDPPFFSEKNYELIWKDEDDKLVKSKTIAFRDTASYFTTPEEKAYNDRFTSGVYNYIEWMIPRLKELHLILSSTGSIYLHCDWHASHYLKIEMDKIFGYNNFRNEIVWHYFMGGKAKNFFARKHDNIFLYTKSNNHTFNPMKHKRRLDFKPGLTNDAKDADTGKDEFGYYSTVTMDDVWDIKGVFNMSNEYQGYPTQKPEALLDRIIKASSNENDLILDPFCGCGTTVAVAKKLNRKFIGIDISPYACMLISKRINYPNMDIIGFPFSFEGLKKMEPHEFQHWACDKMQAKNTNPSGNKSASGPDKGVDGISSDVSSSPIQVTQRTAGEDVIKKFYTTLDKDDNKRGYVIAFDFSSGAKELAAELKNKKGIDIKLITVEELMKKGILRI